MTPDTIQRTEKMLNHSRYIKDTLVLERRRILFPNHRKELENLIHFHRGLI
jgi:hypothetical protein